MTYRGEDWFDELPMLVRGSLVLVMLVFWAICFCIAGGGLKTKVEQAIPDPPFGLTSSR